VTELGRLLMEASRALLRGDVHTYAILKARAYAIRPDLLVTDDDLDRYGQLELDASAV
jgi:hypothetical protein